MSELEEKVDRVLHDEFAKFWKLNCAHVKGIDMHVTRIIWAAGFVAGSKFGTGLGIDSANQAINEVFGD
jgi:hypothetical protein